MVQPIPAGYHNVTPYLIVRNGAAAIDFYKKAFNAVELMRFPGPGGKIMHAEVKIGDSPVMLADEMPEEGHVGPQTLGGVGVSMMVYVQDVDKQFAQAVAAGISRIFQRWLLLTDHTRHSAASGCSWYLNSRK